MPKTEDDNMAYCNEHQRAYPMTLGCPECKKRIK